MNSHLTSSPPSIVKPIIHHHPQNLEDDEETSVDESAHEALVALSRSILDNNFYPHPFTYRRWEDHLLLSRVGQAVVGPCGPGGPFASASSILPGLCPDGGW